MEGEHDTGRRARRNEYAEDKCFSIESGHGVRCGLTMGVSHGRQPLLAPGFNGGVTAARSGWTVISGLDGFSLQDPRDADLAAKALCAPGVAFSEKSDGILIKQRDETSGLFCVIAVCVPQSANQNLFFNLNSPQDDGGNRNKQNQA